MKYYKHDGVIDIRFTETEAISLMNWLSHFKPDENGTVAGALLRIFKQFPSMLREEGRDDMVKHNVSNDEALMADIVTGKKYTIDLPEVQFTSVVLNVRPSGKITAFACEPDGTEHVLSAEEGGPEGRDADTEPRAQSAPPPPHVERAMHTLAKVWEPQVVSCAHCQAHMALSKPDDLAHFIDIHERCG